MVTPAHQIFEVTLGAHRTGEEDTQAIRAQPWKSITPIARQLLLSPGFKREKNPRVVKIVSANLWYLGLKPGAQFEDLCAAGKSKSLDLCPAEAAPLLMLQLDHTFHLSWMTFVMEPLITKGGNERVFSIGPDSGVLTLTAELTRNFAAKNEAFLFLQSNEKGIVGIPDKLSSLKAEATPG